ncbi:myotrophin-like [Corticium candelabrum]|uniref:myotrophin-like n=1 Tax=Corticium candelabrum TaxID=121492 RepID=UPI002E25DD51|nr:myotrophin-like [Corticium candelabrum]
MGEPLVWAVKNGDLDQVKSLAPTVDLNKELINGRMAIHFAADYGQKDVIEYLITRKADVNIPDKHGITPLLAAVFEDHAECVRLLIQNGARKDGKAPGGQSYIDCAESDAVRRALLES